MRDDDAFDTVRSRIAELKGRMESEFEWIHRKLDRLNEKIDKLDVDLYDLDIKIDRLDMKIDRLERRINDFFSCTHRVIFTAVTAIAMLSFIVLLLSLVLAEK